MIANPYKDAPPATSRALVLKRGANRAICPPGQVNALSGCQAPGSLAGSGASDFADRFKLLPRKTRIGIFAGLAVLAFLIL